jgi:heme exporter protein CcmD
MSLESLQLNTYASYVWSCYGLTLVCLIWLAWYVRNRWQEALTHARRRLEMKQSEGELS